ncbi:uncharacterized protein DUF485 [Panacagrimonas perspica]|uniref:Uncharacterized protein DUF485 n=2 Tax=Panacagrimonas perspica TaxID=381431 RepID=A0A4V3F5G5_9GAMM|nr:uncharacterized protein DUF485 [Panacagrimonas perspica]THD02269.1 hypothetical protein B1810_15180 [Panacagrimonas perspica]
MKNQALSFLLSAGVCAAYFGLLAFASLYPEIAKSSAIGALPWSIVLAMSVIVLAVALTVLYVRFANAADARADASPGDAGRWFGY